MFFPFETFCQHIFQQKLRLNWTINILSTLAPHTSYSVIQHNQNQAGEFCFYQAESGAEAGSEADLKIRYLSEAALNTGAFALTGSSVGTGASNKVH